MKQNKKILAYIIVILAIASIVFFAFFHDGNEKKLISDDTPASDETTKTSVEFSDTVEPENYAVYKMKYLDPVTVGCGIGNLNWDRADEIGARFFLDFIKPCAYLMPKQNIRNLKLIRG